MKVSYKCYSYCRAIVPGLAEIADYKSQLVRKYTLAPNLNESPRTPKKGMRPWRFERKLFARTIRW